jgi:hypothetical protein
VPHKKSNRKERLPHFEKVTQIRKTIRQGKEPAGQHGVKNERKKTLTQEIAARYRSARRKEKTAILNEFTATAAYNRKYALRVLNQYGKTKTATIDGKTAKLKAINNPAASSGVCCSHKVV